MSIELFPYHGYRFPPEIISYAVWLYLRFCLSFRDVEELLAERLARDQNLRRIRQVGRTAWKRECGYHRRSLAETAMFRLKTIFSDRVTARGFAGQGAQLLVRCAALNRMTQLGKPESFPA